MKATSAAAVKGNEGTGTPVIVSPSSNIIDEAESKGSLYRIACDVSAMPWEKLDFRRNLLRLALRTLCHRNPKGKASLFPVAADAVVPAIADVTDESFISAILGVTFQGDTVPNDADKASAKAIITHCGDDKAKQAKMVATIMAKHGQEVEISMDSLSLFFMEERLEKARKAKEELNSLIQG